MTDAFTVVGATVAAASLEFAEFSLTALADAARVVVPVVAAWLALLWLGRTREPGILGSGAAEYKRVAHATGFAFGILSILFVIFQLNGLRLQLAIALPVGLLALLVGRWLWRKRLIQERKNGDCVSRAIVAGTRPDVEYVIRNLLRDPHHCYRVIAVTTNGHDPIVVDGTSFPVVGGIQSTADRARFSGADAIIVASTPKGDRDFLRRLAWQLEGAAAELVVCSRLTEVAGPRISFTPLDGLPLIQVKIPEFEGGVHAFKRAFDLVFSSLALIPILLLTPFIALAIRLDSPGPVFFRQTRVGRDGGYFQIFKFRTMRVDAEAQLELLRAGNEGAGPLFKLRRDPRVTRVGAFLRKYSLDELPQFFNVLRGEMSVVGPRPPLPREVLDYDGTVCRRLYIKPGITGLWQVSGRSDLSWEESVRLDLRYVENWSLTSDLMIMWRTAQVMLTPKGAY
ncbi:Undecaprenyl-phosphate galactose phosphotransferase WbaP/exopolysaccharide biosynthesis polyprenyl glycosylphosphotransferase [Microbacterium sp. BK668]|nr:Undecaprenyl-phosphate galactose phosphotransferase WbaP/exopolysaccharide biosynthesis polyprenyl glycosylphosphotransferase [Microbacterium sp. BK668]